MIEATAGHTFEATLNNAPTGLVGTLGVRIVDTPGDTIVLARTTAGITEVPAGSGLYSVTLTAPSDAGQLSVVWDTGGVSPTYAREELTVTAAPSEGTTDTGDLVGSGWATIILDGTGDPAVDLTDLEAVRRLLQTPDDKHDQDALFQDLITEASVMLQRALGRQFVAETGATKAFAYQGDGWVDLAPHDLRSVDAVTYDSDGTSPVEVTDGNWRLRSDTGDGTYLALLLSDYTSRRVYGDAPRVQITGDWGFESVPADVERGVKIAVKTWLREGATFTPDGDVIRFERVGRVPQDVLDGLSHYRPVLVG